MYQMNPWQQMSMMGGYQPQMQQQMGQLQGAQQGDARIDKLKGRIGNLQEQYKGAPSDQQAGIQARMDQMQGRVKNLRADRRQGEGMYDPQAGGGAQPDIARGGMAPPMMMPGGYGGFMGMGGYGGGWGGMGGGNQWMQPQMSMMGGQFRGGPTQYLGGQMGNSYQPEPAQQQGNAAPQGQSTRGGYNSAATAPGQETIKGFFNSPFGQLTTASGGNSNVFKQQGGDENMLYHFDPSQGWKTMDQNAYRGYGDYNYADPSQYANSGAVTQQFQRTNVPQNMLGRGFR